MLFCRLGLVGEESMFPQQLQFCVSLLDNSMLETLRSYQKALSGKNILMPVQWVVNLFVVILLTNEFCAMGDISFTIANKMAAKEIMKWFFMLELNKCSQFKDYWWMYNWIYHMWGFFVWKVLFFCQLDLVALFSLFSTVFFLP